MLDLPQIVRVPVIYFSNDDIITCNRQFFESQLKLKVLQSNIYAKFNNEIDSNYASSFLTFESNGAECIVSSLIIDKMRKKLFDMEVAMDNLDIKYKKDTNTKYNEFMNNIMAVRKLINWWSEMIAEFAGYIFDTFNNENGFMMLNQFSIAKLNQYTQDAFRYKISVGLI